MTILEFFLWSLLKVAVITLVMLLGVARDLLVDRRVHKVYLYGIPLLVIGQNLAIYLWRGAPGWRFAPCRR